MSLCGGSVGRIQMTTTSDNCSPNVDKMSLTSSTLKRNPKMELSRSDLLRLLSILEGELQAREIVIAVLKAEQIKKLLYPNNKCSENSSFGSKTMKLNTNANNCDNNLVQYCDPWNALSRDAFGAYDPSFDKTTTIALFNMKMTQLEALILQQRRARNGLTDQLRVIETKYNKIVDELEEEKRLRSETNGGLTSGQTSGADLKFENDIKDLKESLENERNREKQIVLCLLSERKQLIIKLIEERQRNEELLHLLSTEKGKIAEMVEGLEDESKRSLQMEAELEKYLSDFEGEREKFRNQLSASETRNAELAAEVDRLRQQLNGKQLNSISLGEGVRSAIVTMSSATRCVPTVPSVSTVSHPRASVAQHVSPKSLANSAQTQSTAKTTPNSKSSASGQHSYATVQPISSVKMNATIPPPPSVPAPPPKALISNKSTANPQTAKVNAFQNITYNLEPIAPKTPNPSTTSPTPVVAGTQSNHSTNVNQMANTSTVSKVMVQMSQTPTTQSTAQSVAQPIQPNLPNPTVQRKLSATSLGRGTPPPIPPNKPIIKPVLPPQALQQRSKDLNSTKVMSGSVGTQSKTVSAINSTNNANTPTNTTNSLKNATINTSDGTGEQNCRQKSTDSINETNSANTGDTTDTNNVDLLCQELENFNSLLVSMVSTGSQMVSTGSQKNS